jgi:hypothetical protein
LTCVRDRDAHAVGADLTRITVGCRRAARRWWGATAVASRKDDRSEEESKCSVSSHDSHAMSPVRKCPRNAGASRRYMKGPVSREGFPACISPKSRQ